MKELTTDRARKYGKILSQLSLRGHWPRVAVRLPGWVSARATQVQLSNTWERKTKIWANLPRGYYLSVMSFTSDINYSEQ